MIYVSDFHPNTEPKKTKGKIIAMLFLLFLPFWGEGADEDASSVIDPGNCFGSLFEVENKMFRGIVVGEGKSLIDRGGMNNQALWN